jgi:hypothetical protein
MALGGGNSQRAVDGSKFVIVILNLFQDPGAVGGHKDGVRGARDRAWMLKQVQHDDTCVAGINTEQARMTARQCERLGQPGVPAVDLS